VIASFESKNTTDTSFYGGSQSLYEFTLIDADEDKGTFNVTITILISGEQMTGQMEAYWDGSVYFDGYEDGLTQYLLYCSPEELDGNEIVDLPTALGTFEAYKVITEAEADHTMITWYHTTTGIILKRLIILRGLTNPETGEPSVDLIFYELFDSNVEDFSASKMVVELGSPANLFVVDSEGRRVGFDPETGNVLNEIPGATYSGPETEPEVITLMNPEGIYEIQVIGTDIGSYTLTVKWTDPSTGQSTAEVFTGDVSSGTIHTYKTEVTDTGAKTSLLASVDIDPDTMNLKSNGRWVTCYIQLPEGYDVTDIDVSTILLNGIVHAQEKPIKIGDHNGDGFSDLMVKFDRSQVQNQLTPGTDVRIMVSGSLVDGTPFEGFDTIRVISPVEPAKEKATVPPFLKGNRISLFTGSVVLPSNEPCFVSQGFLAFPWSDLSLEERKAFLDHNTRFDLYIDGQQVDLRRWQHHYKQYRQLEDVMVKTFYVQFEKNAFEAGTTHIFTGEWWYQGTLVASQTVEVTFE